ncbi:DUF742 domain-containing protein [Streptomyces sp. KLOTTS4A1]|uniref:DUF742 domain-containing protein n=1 Tax=Streptomyces sp. KLOTTS4A1 TaxID=3390996 RepID=UPI0039F630E9
MMDARENSEEEQVAGPTPRDGSSAGGWSYGQGQGDNTSNHYGYPSAPGHQERYAPPQRPRDPYEQQQAPRRSQPDRPAAPRSPEQSPGRAQNPLVRPYAMTGGRTRPRYQLAIEALVHTTAQPHQLQGQLPEHQRICNLCHEIKSVAEVSALLSIPLGVARILVADLAEAGLVAIHQPGGDENSGGQPDVTLLERVLSGLRKL